MRTIVWMLLAMTLLCVRPARACLWDEDTLRDEQRGLPGVAEAIAGKIERHSAFFYEERVRRMNERLAQSSDDLAALDNLAVAYEKLGQVDRAIETIRRKEAIRPDEYTTHANLGTFLVHAGELEAGLAELRRALAINPDAHFGRERYQVMAVEYLLAAKADPSVYERGSFTWPIVTSALNRGTTQPTTRADDQEYFAADLARRRNTRDPAIDKAVDGIVGMLRFGPGQSPILFAGLGDLLAARGDYNLAARAYLRARQLEHPPTKWLDERIETLRQVSTELGDVEPAFADEQRAAAAWVSAFQRAEEALIRDGRDPSDPAAMAPFYAEHGTSRETPARNIGDWMSGVRRSPGAVIGLVTLSAVAGVSVLRIGLRFARSWRTRRLPHRA